VTGTRKELWAGCSMYSLCEVNRGPKGGGVSFLFSQETRVRAGFKIRVQFVWGEAEEAICTHAWEKMMEKRIRKPTRRRLTLFPRCDRRAGPSGNKNNFQTLGRNFS